MWGKKFVNPVELQVCVFDPAQHNYLQASQRPCLHEVTGERFLASEVGMWETR